MRNPSARPSRNPGRKKREPSSVSKSRVILVLVASVGVLVAGVIFAVGQGVIDESTRQQGRLDDLESSVNSFASRIDALESKIDRSVAGLRGDIESLESDLLGSSRWPTDIRVRSPGPNGYIGDLESDIRSLESDISSLESDISSLGFDISSLEIDIRQ